MAQTQKLIVIFCFFPQKCFPGSSGDSECSFFKHVWKYLPNVQFFYSKSVDFFKYIFIVEKQHFSSKMSSGHVGWNFDRHAFVFHKSYFFWLKFRKKIIIFSQKSTPFPQKFLRRLTMQFCQLYRKAFAQSLKFFHQSQNIFNMFFFQKLAFLKNSPGHVECKFNSPAKKMSVPGLT